MDLISAKYNSFDTSCDDAGSKFPNIELAFPCNIDNITIAAQDKNGNIQSLRLNIDEKGKGWNIDRLNECGFDRINDEDLAASYFNNCCETGGFDEGLIRGMSVCYQIPVAEIKAVIVSARCKINKSKEAEREE